MSALLPGMLYHDEIRQNVQTAFGGYNHNLYATDGALWDMENLTSDLYPVLSARKPRYLIRQIENANGIYAVQRRGLYSDNYFFWADKTKLYKALGPGGGLLEEVGEVENSKKTFCTIGNYLIILPDKKCYDIKKEVFQDLEARWSGDVIVRDGTFAGEAAAANTIYAQGVHWEDYFKAGDAVHLSIGAEVLGTLDYPLDAIIREIDGDELHFYENTFEFRDGGSQVSASASINRLMPPLEFICENDNRLWGCSEGTIYASKLGDPFNWNVFDGLSTDSYAANIGSYGAFTGCISYLGYPHFFKEDNIYKVYGDKPQNFQVVKSANVGVMDGSAKSLAVAGGTLFYLSRSGVVSYTGGLPQSISEPFGGKRYRDAVAGSDGRKYYISMFDDEDARWSLFVFDTDKRLWHKEDGTQAADFCYFSGLYFLDEKGTLWLNPGGRHAPKREPDEDKMPSMAEFGDFTGQMPNKKGVSKLSLRLELLENAYVTVYIQFDSDGYWQEVSNFYTTTKKSFQLPIIPRRCDHFRIKITGIGEWRLYSLATESYAGSEM